MFNTMFYLQKNHISDLLISRGDAAIDNTKHFVRNKYIEKISLTFGNTHS